MDWFETNFSITFYLLLAVALLLSRIPLAGKYFRSVNTLVHEAGHAFITLLFSGEVIAVNLFNDTSGTTVTKSKSRFSQVLTALAGYPASSLMAWLSLYLVSANYDLYVLFILTSIALVLMVLSIRNMYGLFWAGTFVVINLLLIYFDNRFAIRLAANFYTLILLVDAVISSLILLMLAYRQPKKAGDATNLHKITGIHAILWSLIFAVFALAVAWLCIKNYFPPFSGILNLL